MPTALVTGANRGLGLEFVRQYATEGWDVLACARQPDSATDLLQLAASAADRIEVHALDLEDLTAIDALARQLHGRPIDVLICCAGTMGDGSFARDGFRLDAFGTADYDNWARVFRINAFAPMKLAEAFVTHIAASEQKKLVALTSILSSITRNLRGGLYSYRGSKSALNAIMRSLSIDLRNSHGIIAALIHPGWVRTDMGGPAADIDATTSVTGMRKLIAGLTADDAGRLWMYDGSELPW